MMAEIKGVSQQLTETVSAINSQNDTIHKQTEIIHDTHLEMSRYYAGLERANNDIQEIRDNQRTTLLRLENAVSKDQFDKLEAHVKTLNGTDAKFRLLGIDINDPKCVDEVRQYLRDGMSSKREYRAVTVRIVQGLALVIAMTVGAAAWQGVQENVINKTEIRR